MWLFEQFRNDYCAWSGFARSFFKFAVFAVLLGLLGLSVWFSHRIQRRDSSRALSEAVHVAEGVIDRRKSETRQGPATTVLVMLSIAAIALGMAVLLLVSLWAEATAGVRSGSKSVRDAVLVLLIMAGVLAFTIGPSSAIWSCGRQRTR